MSFGYAGLEREAAALQGVLGGPRLTLITTTIIPVEACDRPGWECPLTGSREVRGLEVIDDLSFIVANESASRTNRWDLSGRDLEAYDELVKEAIPWQQAREEGEPFWHVPIIWQVPEEEVEDLRDDRTTTLYYSGGWRSGKTNRLLRWWQRGWAKYGRAGERFWLVGPEVVNAWRMYEKAFIGSTAVPPLFPSHDPTRPSWMIVGDPPVEMTYDRLALSFRLIDGSIVEAYHLRGKTMSHIEGESVRRIAYDEACSSPNSKGYGVCRGRVMQCRGQVGISSVPDEECDWLYEEVVAEYEKHGCHQPTKLTYFERERPLPRTRKDPKHVKVRYISVYDNPWVEDAILDEALEAETDPIRADNKLRGLWTRRGQYAYVDVWSAERFTRDELSHDSAAWGLGPDITREVLEDQFKLLSTSGYGGGVDFSNGGDKPQTRVWFKIFGRIEDWQTWNLVILDEESTRSDALEASRQSARRKGGRYKGSAVVGDANGFHRPHRERGGGETSQRSNDAKLWENAGFHMCAPQRSVGKDRRAHFSNPYLGLSRTVVRDLMRRGRLWLNAGACPGTLNALHKAPNRRKRNADKNTWIEKTVYGYEDCVRYIAWRIFSKHLEDRILEAQANDDDDDEMEGAA